MEEFKKIIKPNQKINNVVQPIKTVTIPTYDDLAKATLQKDKYLSEFSTEKDKRRVRENLGIGNNFKVVGEYDNLEELQQNVPKGNESEAYLVNGEIYCWSSDLNRYYKYSQESRKVITITDIDIRSAEDLYTTLKRSEITSQFYGTIGASMIDLQISETINGYSIYFSLDNQLNCMSIQKIENTYIGTWNVMSLI